jgi:hypothetical protein
MPPTRTPVSLPKIVPSVFSYLGQLESNSVLSDKAGHIFYLPISDMTTVVADPSLAMVSDMR